MAELFQVLTKHPYEPILQLIPQEAKCIKKELDAERALESKNYMIDTTQCVTKGGKLKANGLFDIFTRYSHKTPSETRSDMIDWVNENSKKLNKYATFTLRKWGKTVANWLNDMRSENTLGDKIAIYCLSNMYLRHVFVKTSKLFWTTVSHTWNDNEASLRPKCELILMYLGHGRYGEYISVVAPENEILTLEDLSTNRPTSPTPQPAIHENNKKSGTSSMLKLDSRSINKPSNKKGIKNKQNKQMCDNNDPIPGK